jgi:hypothetical protein
VNRSFSERLRLNSALGKNKYWRLPVDDTGHEDYVPVGRGRKSSEFCSRWVSFSVCKNVEGHKGVFLGGSDCSGKVVVVHNHLWCHKSSCPVCFIRGWSLREARSIAGRFIEAEKRGLGKVEHIVCSVAIAERNNYEWVLRERSRRILAERGVVGGCMIFHGYREAKDSSKLEWSPHFHILGIIGGGYKCRDCNRKGNCLKGCGGFDDVSYQAFLKDRYYVKVLPERKTVLGTAWYQLHHATIRLGIKRFQAVTWFGVCSCRKFKGESVEAENVCPACGDEMVKSHYVGKRYIVKDVGSPDYVPLFVDDEFDEDGKPNYVDAGGGRCG